MDIHIRHLWQSFDRRGGAPLEVFANLHLTVKKGEFVVLLGPSGCGKSTLLHILAGLLEPTGGEVLLGGKPPHVVRALKQIGWMAQNPALLPWLKVSENVAMAQHINPQNGRRLPTPEDLLQMVGLTDFMSAYPFMLSGGMQHRVALARTLALGAKLWLMDEPFSSLDELTREELEQNVYQLWMRFSPTVLWVTHSVYEALRLAQRVLVMTKRPARIQAEFILQPRPEGEVSNIQYVDAIRQALRDGQG